MEPYAYFPYNEESEAVTLFEYIDKKLQGEEIPTFETVADIQIDNIYISSDFRRNFILYFDSINNFFAEIEKYPLNNDKTKEINIFLEEIKSLIPKNFLKDRQYMTRNNWKHIKHFFRENKKFAFFHLLNELYFNIGLKTNISFDEFEQYINTSVRLDYIYLYSNYGISENKESLQRKINKNPELELMISMTKSYTFDEYFELKGFLKSITEITSDNKNRNKIRRKYLHIVSREKKLLSCMNKRYYIFGRQEKHKRAKQLIVKQQHQENIRRFNAQTGIAIDENPARSVCMNCGDKKQIIYDVNLYTPFKHTVSSVCTHCLPSIADGLKQTIRNHYTYYPISSQLAVNCQHSDRPINICHKCGSLSNTIFEFVAAREINSVILCRACVKEVIKKIDKKLKTETLNGKKEV